MPAPVTLSRPARYHEHDRAFSDTLAAVWRDRVWPCPPDAPQRHRLRAWQRCPMSSLIHTELMSSTFVDRSKEGSSRRMDKDRHGEMTGLDLETFSTYSYNMKTCVPATVGGILMCHCDR